MLWGGIDRRRWSVASCGKIFTISYAIVKAGRPADKAPPHGALANFDRLHVLLRPGPSVLTYAAVAQRVAAPGGLSVRRVFLDTESTGLDTAVDRLVEVGAVEADGRKLTGRELRHLVNPGRAIPLDAVAIHGIRDQDVADKPDFSGIADELIEFVRGAEVLIHNASFDVGLIDAELARIGRPGLRSICTVVDTLKLAKERDPGKRSSLDALCERYGVNASARSLHGALLDARLLAEVWIAMTRGQESLLMDDPEDNVTSSVPLKITTPLVVLQATEDELAAHENYLAGMRSDGKAAPLWDQFATEPAERTSRLRP